MNNIYRTKDNKNFIIRWTRWYDARKSNMKHKVLIVNRLGNVYEGFIRTDKRKLKRQLRSLGYIN